MVLDSDGRRVALLARPGLARERLSDVLQEAGANCVISADPTQLKPEDLRSLHPEVVVVALDALTEEALEQFDDVLGDRSVEVIYEEAEQAASREGWDAARWQRHLVAKLQGHSNVLPPGHEPAAADAASFAQAAAATPAAAAASDAASAFDPVSAEFDGFALDTGFAPLDTSLPGLSVPDQDASAAVEHSGDADGLEIPSWDEAASGSPSSDDAFSGFDFTVEASPPQPSAGEAHAPGASVFDDFDAISAFSPLNAEIDEPVSIEPTSIESASIEPASIEPASITPDGTEGAALPGASPTLSLQGDELEIQPMDMPASRDSFRHDLGDLEQRISSMSLVDDTPRLEPAASGAVLILSGVGGPDAVRQLLGAMPIGFARPVLVQQRLEGGRYDRLVTQLQRATKLTVTLAEPAQTAEAGKVYILSDSIGATAGEGGIRFNDDAGDAVMSALPSSDSAVLLLSGSDPDQVDAVMAHSRAGALVAGQAAEGCYDAAAPDALAARGGEVAAPAALALRLSARWSTRGTRNVEA